jgi:hypothetical protein
MPLNSKIYELIYIAAVINTVAQFIDRVQALERVFLLRRPPRHPGGRVLKSPFLRQ